MSNQRADRASEFRGLNARRRTVVPRVWAAASLLWVPGLGTVSPALAQSGRLDARATCYRALSDWTRQARRDPAPFHLRPAVASLFGPAGEPSDRSEAGVGLQAGTRVLRASESLSSDDGYIYPGPTPAQARTEPFASLLLRWRAGPLALAADVSAGRKVDVGEALVAARPGGILVSAGRSAPGSGYECWSGLALSGRGRTDALGIDTPWWRVPLLGPISLSTSFGTIREGATGNERPFFVVLRGVWAAGENLRVGVTRALLFGGRATSVPVTFRTVGLMLLGVTDVEGKDSDFENQVASVDLSYRTRVGGSPVRFHLEYAVDDYGLAFLRVPALALGGTVVGERGSEVRSLGAELVWIAPSARDYPPWYRHGALAWGWTDRGVPLGHELAGEGWALRVDAFRSSVAGDLAARLLISRRGGENLLAPVGAGWAAEGTLEARRRLGSAGGRPILLGIEAAAGAVGHHEYIAVALAGLYRF